PGPAHAERRGRRHRHRAGPNLPAGPDPDGHQPARYQRDRSAENTARGSIHGADPDPRAQRERRSARHRERPRGRILQVPHEADQGRPVHGCARCGPEMLDAIEACDRQAAVMRIAESDILGARVLIVDDQEVNVRLLEQMLREAGYTSIASTMDPQEVCALHRRNRYDLILLDLQMPAMDGFQVIESLKTNVADGYLPVLVITAQPGHKLRALQTGVRDFISKPFDLIEVKTRIRNMLEV